MAQPEKYIVILPYFCQEEVDRYLKIADWLKKNCATPLPCHFLLAASPRTDHSQELYQAFDQVGECTAFQCPSQVFGYPEGPTAMFWDTMDYIAENFSEHTGFSLWLESDMAFSKKDWLPRLVHEWQSDNDQAPLVMGCFVPEVYKHRLFRKKKLILHPHINGGACYALDFAKRMPEESRVDVFDMAVYQYGKEIGGVKKTRQIAFSTNDRVRRDLLDPEKCVLHGFMQDKDQFIDQCVEPITERERKQAGWIPLQDKLERVKRRVRVCFVRRGHQAMLENMMLAKHQLESRKAA
jgi:hypothetical protein